MFTKLGIIWLIKFSAYRLHSNKSNFRRLLNKNNPPHRTGSGTITGTTLVEKRYQWSRKRFWDLICAGRTISFTTACVSTVPNSSSGLTVHSKHVFGLQSCSLRKEHPTVSALKSTAISAHHKILTFARSVARCHQNCIIFQLTVEPYHKISLNLTEPWRQALSDIQTLEGEIYWNISKDTLLQAFQSLLSW